MIRISEPFTSYPLSIPIFQCKIRYIYMYIVIKTPSKNDLDLEYYCGLFNVIQIILAISEIKLNCSTGNKRDNRVVIKQTYGTECLLVLKLYTLSPDY